MRIDQHRINKEVSDENFLDEELVKSISDIGFKRWSEWTHDPDSLILKIDYLGKNYFKKKKTEDRLETINMYGENSFYLEDGMKEKFEFILSEYDKYLEEKKKFRNNDI